MNKQKFLVNLFIFIAAGCLVVSFFTKQVVPTILAVVFALLAQNIYRKLYPRKTRSYKELIEEKYKNKE